ncbi:MAG: hypothetical protein ACP5F9_07775 [Thiomonas sp.]
MAAVLGAGDVGSAVAHTLFSAGYDVVLFEDEQPTAPRRGMCWVDAVFDGKATLAGLTAVRVFQPDEAAQAVAQRDWLPLAVGADLPRWLEALGADLLVDARLRKHATAQPDLRAFGLPSIGIGPGYSAGEQADLVVESAWGEDLGRVIEHGATRALAGEPRPILGVGRERLIYAPAAGVFASGLRIGDAVRAGDPVGLLHGAQGDAIVLHAPLSGVLRGLTRPGVTVQRRTKLVEVDPRGDPALCFGLGERPSRIARGVLQAADRLRHTTLQREQARQVRAA